MAKDVLDNAFISVDGTNISDHCSSVTIETNADKVEVTGFGATHRQYTQGLKDANISLEVFQDYAAASVDQILAPLHDSGGTFPVVVRPTSAVKSATNPEYTMTGVLFDYSPLQGAVGDANTTSVTISNAGTAGLARGTA